MPPLERLVILARRLSGVPVVGEGGAEAAVGGEGRCVVVKVGVVERAGSVGLHLPNASAGLAQEPQQRDTGGTQPYRPRTRTLVRLRGQAEELQG